jgi:thioredoxin 2
MPQSPDNADKLNMLCAGCGQRVRFLRARLQEQPKCPSCHQALLAGAPAALDDASFERFIQFNDLPVLIDFWAPWCGPCRSFSPIVGQVASDLKGSLLVAKVDTDAAPGLGNRFNIRSIPTVAIFRGGVEIARESGAMPKAALLAWLAKHGIPGVT